MYQHLAARAAERLVIRTQNEPITLVADGPVECEPFDLGHYGRTVTCRTILQAS
jgi:hypothetical protein